MDRILVGKGEQPVFLLAKYGNRHGLVAGATGTGKTVSLMTVAEGFSRLGVPVFIADVKGDVSGLAVPGTPGERIQQRVQQLGIEGYAHEGNPVVFWDMYGKSGHPVRTTISEVGPTLLSRMLELSDAQEGMLEIVFRLADERGLLLLDMDDLRALLAFIAENQKEISSEYGLVSTQSVAAIQRSLLALEREGGELLFGEPALELTDLLRTDLGGRGVINILAADQLILKPRLYSTFLLWLLSELFENLPEVGDLDKPRLVFCFDEAHLLFNDAPPPLRQRVEQVVRLIRSKGVGVYFCSQFPDDVPGEILGQLGNRFQHALRAFTPRDHKAVRTAAETFVPNPKLDVARVISELGVGEALVSTLQDKAIPAPVERTMMAPPRSRMGAITPEERATIRSRSPVGAKYDTTVNRESAYEMLKQRAETQAAAEAPARQQYEPQQRTDPRSRSEPQYRREAPQPEQRSVLKDWVMGTSRRQGMAEAMAKQAARTVGSQLGRQILRGVLGGILGGGRRR
jgi:DNA helicase HerA-like ATPase